LYVIKINIKVNCPLVNKVTVKFCSSVNDVLSTNEVYLSYEHTMTGNSIKSYKLKPVSAQNCDI